MKQQKTFTRFDVRQFVDIPRWLQIVAAPLIWFINRWMLVSSYANSIMNTSMMLLLWLDHQIVLI